HLTVYLPGSLDSLTRALGAIPVHGLGSPLAVQAVLDLSERFVFLDASLRSFDKGPWGDADIMKAITAVPSGPERQQMLKDIDGQLRKNVLTAVDLIAETHARLKSAVKP
ncbi:hypothetical protein, partial [Agrobacterium tumefaciens]|uniref:hypothetical protein n=1 Tax=Agrobacterium tumefaciens TaxID=358 RepID=UPI003BA2A347